MLKREKKNPMQRIKQTARPSSQTVAIFSGLLRCFKASSFHFTNFYLLKKERKKKEKKEDFLGFLKVLFFFCIFFIFYIMCAEASSGAHTHSHSTDSRGFREEWDGLSRHIYTRGYVIHRARAWEKRNSRSPVWMMSEPVDNV